jgi:hypothetical protein
MRAEIIAGELLRATCSRRATVGADHPSAALPPKHARISALNGDEAGAKTEGVCLGKSLR